MNQYRFCLFLLAAGLSFDVALADFTVSNTNSQGPGSLDDAVRAANNISSLKTIRFSLPGNGPWTITVSRTLTIIAPVVIDGTSQAGYDGAFNRIYVECAAGISSVFLLTAHNGTTISGLGMYNYDQNGITIWKDSSWNFIDDDYIGFKKTTGGVLHNTGRASLCAGIGIQGNYNKVRRTTISGVYNGINLGEAIEGTVTGLV